MGYEISRHFFVHRRYTVEVVSPLGGMEHSHGVSNQVNLDILLTVGTRDGQILEQVGDAHALAVRYEGLHAVGQKTGLIRVIGDHVSVLPA